MSIPVCRVSRSMAPTARHLEYTAYKANREKMPEDIGLAIPYIKRLLGALNIPVLFAEGYEADDVIGTLAKKAEKEGFKVYMVTPDKDFGQLVDEDVYLYKPARMGSGVEIMGPAEVCARFGIEIGERIVCMHIFEEELAQLGQRRLCADDDRRSPPAHINGVVRRAAVENGKRHKAEAALSVTVFTGRGIVRLRHIVEQRFCLVFPPAAFNEHGDLVGAAGTAHGHEVFFLRVGMHLRGMEARARIICRIAQDILCKLQ